MQLQFNLINITEKVLVSVKDDCDVQNASGGNLETRDVIVRLVIRTLFGRVYLRRLPASLQHRNTHFIQSLRVIISP
jgi:hypothetical protein